MTTVTYGRTRKSQLFDTRTILVQLDTSYLKSNSNSFRCRDADKSLIRVRPEWATLRWTTFPLLYPTRLMLDFCCDFRHDGNRSSRTESATRNIPGSLGAGRSMSQHPFQYCTDDAPQGSDLGPLPGVDDVGTPSVLPVWNPTQHRGGFELFGAYVVVWGNEGRLGNSGRRWRRLHGRASKSHPKAPCWWRQVCSHWRWRINIIIYIPTYLNHLLLYTCVFDY